MDSARKMRKYCWEKFRKLDVPYLPEHCISTATWPLPLAATSMARVRSKSLVLQANAKLRRKLRKGCWSQDQNPGAEVQSHLANTC